MDQIFNELSANGSYTDKYAACSGMERMLRLSIELEKCGFKNVLRVVEGFSQLSIAPDFSIVQWARDKSLGVDRELQRKLLTSATRAPYVEQFIADEEQNHLIEFHFDNQQALGLGLAYLWGSATISLDGDKQFAESTINIQFHQLYDDKESTALVSVDSISNLEQLNNFCRTLQESQRAGLKNGKVLVEQLSTLFPYLSCGVEAVRHLSTLNGSEQYYPEIIHHFSILNTTIEHWSGGPFELQGLTWSPESESTLKQFASSRKFVGVDAVTRQFSLHTKIKSANQRIYFMPSSEEKVVYIGYVGPHLPTTKFRN